MPYSAVAKLIQKLQLSTANSMFASWNALIFYIRETVNFAAINYIQQFLSSKNEKMYYFGLLGIFYKACIYNVRVHRSVGQLKP